jgi:hypothetical protein
VTSSQRMIPKEYTSAARVTFSPWSTSGAWYAGVPTTGCRLSFAFATLGYSWNNERWDQKGGKCRSDTLLNRKQTGNIEGGSNR